MCQYSDGFVIISMSWILRDHPFFIFFYFFSLRGKLRHLKGEVCWVLSPSDPLPVSCHSLSTLWRRTHPKTRFQPLRYRLRTTGPQVKVVKVGAQREPQLVRRRPKQERRTCNTSNVSASSGQDEIDDIFSSLDF